VVLVVTSSPLGIEESPSSSVATEVVELEPVDGVAVDAGVLVVVDVVELSSVACKYAGTR
jgi:hypothetical protein